MTDTGRMTLFQKGKRCFQGFLADEAPMSAAAISFYAVTSLPPLIVFLVSVAGLVVSDKSFQAFLIKQGAQMYGPTGAEVVSTILVQSGDSAHGLAAVLGLLTLLITASGLHAQLQNALNKMWNIRRPQKAPIKTFLVDRLFATFTIALTGILLVVSLLVTTFLSYASNWLGSRLNIDFFTLQRAQSLGSFLLLTAMIALLYKLLPSDARVAWRDVWRGALITSALLTGTRHLLALYLSNANFSLSYGQAGTLVLFLISIYFSALIFLFGAEWTSIEAQLSGRAIVSRHQTGMNFTLKCMNKPSIKHFSTQL